MPDPNVISIRNLQDSDFGTPLRDFKGILDSYYPDEGGQYGTRVILNFKQLQVLESVEPYLFPTATISIKLSNRKRSSWGIFGESLGKLLPAEKDLKDCVQQMMRLKLTPDHDYGKNRETGEPIKGSAWEVFEVGGVVAGESTTTALDEAKRILDGKTRAQFNQEAYANPIIRKDVNFQRTITDKSFINSMIQLAQFTEDENGVFHKNPAAPAM